MECPNIDKSVPESDFNKKINYRDLGGPVDYFFYDHTDTVGNITRVQFCKLCGRKKDVFECLNEWKTCGHYNHNKKWRGCMMGIKELIKNADAAMSALYDGLNEVVPGLSYICGGYMDVPKYGKTSHYSVHAGEICKGGNEYTEPFFDAVERMVKEINDREILFRNFSGILEDK